MKSPDVEAVLRLHAPRVLAALLRAGGRFGASERAVHLAVATAAERWAVTGVPPDPGGWIHSAAARSLADPPPESVVGSTDLDPVAAPTADDTLRLLVFCCHPAVSVTSQIALTLRAVGGLSTLQIARAFLAAEAAMDDRINRATQTIEASGPSFAEITDADRAARLPAVLQVLHLVFTEGHLVARDLANVGLADAAIRLARLARAELPGDGEPLGLLGLMLLTEARRPARVNAAGEYVPLSQQDRTRWRADLIAEGRRLTAEALAMGPPGPYRLQAAIAAVHAAAPTAADTDWTELLRLHDLLVAASPGPTAEMNRAIAAAEVHGAERGLRLLEALGDDGRVVHQARYLAARGELLERLGRFADAGAAFAAAARVAGTEAERRYLERRAGGTRGPTGEVDR